MLSLENHEQRIRGIGGELEYQLAQNAVLLCAVAALVESHPQPAAFARVFREQWTRLGSQNQAQQADSQASEGMDDALAILEEACCVPLGIRPPGIAQPNRQPTGPASDPVA
ncbi:MAG: hypothetical protein IPN53_15195 [Comamonadaceae bacterium]|nr:hypothetical protein [Comamonadaceae bacterium]